MNDLVTVIVATYNSSKYVLEALKSIECQTWKNVEVVITDDFSTDDTVFVCKNWIEDNKNKFFRSVIIESVVNTGVPANLNRGLKEANGEWLFLLAGDDAMECDCITENMLFVKENPEVKVLFSKVNLYRETFKEENLLKTTPGKINKESIVWPERTPESQYEMLLICDRIHFTPSLFINRNTLISVGGFDERFRLLEDYPLWLNLTRNGIKLQFMDKVTVNYRRHKEAINNKDKEFIVNPNYFINEDFRKIYIYPYLPIELKLKKRMEWYLLQIFRVNLFNENKYFNRFLFFIIKYINPFEYIFWLKKWMKK